MTATLAALEFYDTGQAALRTDEEHLTLGIASHDTGQAAFRIDEEHLTLGIISHDIHRIDEAADGSIENVMSTLKAFVLRIGLFDGDISEPTRAEDGLSLTASLVYDDGQPVEELSVTQEPPLLASAVTLANGVATFKLRITVLTTLCRGNKFRVKIVAPERPELAVATAPMRTITKLRRPLKDKREATKLEPSCSLLAGTKRSSELDECLLGHLERLDELEASLSPQSLNDLWDEVNSNSSLLLKLQKQQGELFRELRELRGNWN